MTGHSLGKPLDIRISCRLGCQFRRELALAAWPNAEHDMPSRNRKGDLSAEIGVDHGKCEIHSRCYACRGPDAMIFDVNCITVDDHPGPKTLERVDLAPVSCCPPSIQSSGRSQKERAVTYRRDARTRPIALDTIAVMDPRASSCCMPGSPPTVMRCRYVLDAR